MREEKVWGHVDHLFGDDDVGISKLHTIEGKRCSIHFHRHRINQFHVVSGRIRVWTLVREEINDECNSSSWSSGFYGTSVGTGDTCTVLTGVPHWFEVVEAGCLVEIYRSDGTGPVHRDDIVRFDKGGEIIRDLRSLTDGVMQWKQQFED